VGNSPHPVAHKVVSDVVFGQLNDQGVLHFNSIEHSLDHCLGGCPVPVTLYGEVCLVKARAVLLKRVGVLVPIKASTLVVVK